VALFDLRMPKATGLDCLRFAREKFPETRVIIISGAGEIKDAVLAMKDGAFEFVTKPFEREELINRVKNAFRDAALEQDNRTLRALVTLPPSSSTFISRTPAGQVLLDRVRKIAPLDSTVLITGESGTGKTTVARMIHELGPRTKQPFVALNCASLPRELIESELFGHTKGAFTGAVSDRPGRVEMADGGTLFLDEIGDLPLELQPKLLTFLQDRSFTRIGSNQVHTVDVRLVSATHQDLPQMCRDKRFREDLFFRLSVLSLHVPSLAERLADIPELSEVILRRIAQRRGVAALSIDREALGSLQSHSWGGNVRELENVLERASAFCDDATIRARDLEFHSGSVPTRRASLAGRTLDDIEMQAIRDTLEANGGNKALAARQLGISEKSIYNKMKRFGMSL
ncbi:MAG TPA: sigma-54 dependent transcriptional regulator, partial [Pirellulaceae bacterium]|nr:sigma-54 dependent transcriptional regulator [Pirellulaceae bacterium]